MDFLTERKIELKKVALYAPSQNGLVKIFNIVIADKLKETERFEWDKEKVLGEMLVDYRSTPHCTVGKSPFELMYVRKMRNKLRLFSPEMPKGKKEDDTGFRVKVKTKQEQ